MTKHETTKHFLNDDEPTPISDFLPGAVEAPAIPAVHPVTGESAALPPAAPLGDAGVSGSVEAANFNPRWLAYFDMLDEEEGDPAEYLQADRLPEIDIPTLTEADWSAVDALPGETLDDAFFDGLGLLGAGDLGLPIFRTVRYVADQEEELWAYRERRGSPGEPHCIHFLKRVIRKEKGRILHPAGVALLAKIPETGSWCAGELSKDEIKALPLMQEALLRAKDPTQPFGKGSLKRARQAQRLLLGRRREMALGVILMSYLEQFASDIFWEGYRQPRVLYPKIRFVPGGLRALVEVDEWEDFKLRSAPAASADLNAKSSRASGSHQAQAPFPRFPYVECRGGAPIGREEDGWKDAIPAD